MRPFSLQQPATIAASKKWLWAKELRSTGTYAFTIWNIEKGGQCRQSRNQHHGFRVIARKKAQSVRLYSRAGNDLTHRSPLIVETLARLRSRSCIIDWEAVACDDDGVASFNLLRYLHHDQSIFLYAFDSIEFNGDDLRRDPLAGRRLTLEKMLGNRPRFFSYYVI